MADSVGAANVILQHLRRSETSQRHRGADGDGRDGGHDYPGLAAIDFGRRGRWAGLVRAAAAGLT